MHTSAYGGFASVCLNGYCENEGTSVHHPFLNLTKHIIPAFCECAQRNISQYRRPQYITSS